MIIPSEEHARLGEHVLRYMLFREKKTLFFLELPRELRAPVSDSVRASVERDHSVICNE